MEIWGRAPLPLDALFILSLHPRPGASEAASAYRETLQSVLPVRGRTMVADVIRDGVALAEEAASVLVETWNDQTGGEQARCHIPRHGLATVRNLSLIHI